MSSLVIELTIVANYDYVFIGVKRCQRLGEFDKDGKAIRKYVEDEVSWGKAAEIAGISKWDA